MADEEPLEIGSSPILKFLDLLSNWDYDLPITTQWSVCIVPEMSDVGDPDGFFQLISDYTSTDVEDFKIDPRLMTKVLSEVTQPNIDGIGLYYAQSFKTPSEGFEIQSVGQKGTGGYLKGNVGGDRNDGGERQLTVEFLETNLDFLDTLIRPWIIASSYRGLIDLGPENSLKASIFIQQYTRNIYNKVIKPIRKFHYFKGCMPISIEGSSMDQEKQETIIKTVKWVYNTYKYSVFSET